MPKGNAKSSITLIGQIMAISSEIDKAAEALAQLDAHAKRLQALQVTVAETMGKHSAQVDELVRKAETGASQSAALARLRVLGESANSSFLKLQTRMQRENQAFTAVSNVLKTRHDTVKNSIGNIK